MPKFTTEIVTVPLVAGSEIGKSDNPASAVMKDSGNTLTQQDGMQQLQFGMQVEDPTVLQLFINWDSKKHHEDFKAKSEYGPFVNRFGSIFASDHKVVHVDFEPDGGLAAALSAPVTEVATFYHEGGPPADAKENVKKFKEICDKDKEATKDVLGFAYGFTYEEVEREGVKGKAVVLAIGWPSVDAHMEFRKGQIFKDHIGLLRNGASKIEMHHTQFMNFVA